MKTRHFRIPVPFLLSFFIIFTGFYIQLMAQDPAIQNIKFPSDILAINRNSAVTLTVTNLGENNSLIDVQIQIFDPDNNKVFDESILPPPIGPGEIVDLDFPPWIPVLPGIHTVLAQILPLNDDSNTLNNTGEKLPLVVDVSFTLEQVDMVNPYNITNSSWGMLCATYQNLDAPVVINAQMQLPGSPSSQYWTVQNFPILPFPVQREVCYWLDFSNMGILEGTDIPVLDLGLQLTDVPVTVPIEITQLNLTSLQPIEVNIPKDNNYEFPVNSTIPLEIPPFTWTPLPEIDWLYRGCTVPNIDLDSSLHKPTPEYAGDWNACGPAAASNSLLWLQETHDSIPPTGQTHREIMEEISGMMERGDEEGVTTQQLIKGKLAYIDEHKLPIHVKYQSWFDSSATIPSPNMDYNHSAENKGGTGEFKPPTWDFLKSEMDKGEDVEIMFGWYDKAADRNGGHWVTVTGTYESGNVRGIYIKDDGTQKEAGGTRESYHGWHTSGDWGRLTGYDGPNNYCWVESVVSESYDNNISFEVFDLKLHIPDWIDPILPTDPLVGFLELSFPPSPDLRYLNVRLNLPGSEKKWMVQNAILCANSFIQTLNIWMDLDSIGLTEGHTVDSLEAEIGVASTFNVDSFFDITYTINIDIDTTKYRIGNGAPDTSPEVVPHVPPEGFVLDPGILIPKITCRGCTVPNIDLDSMLYNPDTEPGYAGDKNACGPAAAANSLQWLEDTHPSIPSTGTSHRDKLKELSEMMKRANNGGVYREDFIKAKLEFIDKHKLPIHVKFQGFYFGTDSLDSPDHKYNHFAENKNPSANAKPDWDWLVQEMENGEDVELEFGYYDEDGNRQGGHWITVTGVTEIAGVKTVYFKDDTDQSNSGGTRYQCTEWVDDDSGYSYLDGLSGSTYTCWVESVVSESYDPGITFCPEKLDLGLSPIPPDTYKASIEIKASGSITGDVIFSAPTTILNSIEVKPGATLEIDQSGCNND